jgi:lycopene cyclase-like protein
VRDAVLVVGDGPSGWAAAAACATAGLPVVLLGPHPDRPWRSTFGAWIDEVDPVGLGDVFARRYERPVVRTDRNAFTLDRPYGIFDNDALKAALAARAPFRIVTGVARRVEHDHDGSTVELASGAVLEAGVVIDASGHRPALAQRPIDGAAWQVAFGIVGRFEPPPLGITFMDWRPVPGSGPPPTFCYAMDLGNGVALVEETVLAIRPATPPSALRERLERRLVQAGVAVRERLAVEQVRFPMGGPLPARGSRVVPFGAAAGMVHPASGYQVAASLQRAPALGGAVAAAVSDRDATPDAVVRAGWDAVWPRHRSRERALHAFGLEVLLRLDQDGIQRFFETFFGLPQSHWSSYLSGAPSPLSVARTMLAVARRLPPRERRAVLHTAVGPDGVAAMRGLTR